MSCKESRQRLQGSLFQPRRLAFWLLLALSPVTGAVDGLRLSIADVRGVGWGAGELDVHVGFGAAGTLDVRFEVGRLALPPPLDAFRSASVVCAGARAEGARVRCDAARLSLRREGGEALELSGSVDVDTARGDYAVVVREQRALGGTLGFSFAGDARGSRVEARARDLSVAALPGIAGALAGAGPLAVSAGRVSVELDARRAGEHATVRAAAVVRDLAFSDASGLRAGEGLGLELRLRGEGPSAALELEADAALSAGAVYFHPLLVQAGDQPLTLSASARRGRDGVLDVSSFTLEHPGVATVRGSARLAPGADTPLVALDLELLPGPVAPLYERYLKAFAGAGAFAALTLQGVASGRGSWRPEGPAEAHLTLEGLDVGDAAGRFTLLGVGGEVHWTRGLAPVDTRLSWRAAQVYALGLGAGQLALRVADRDARLLAPVEVTLLDGAVRLERLEAVGLGRDRQRVEADLSLAPISLERLSERLAWLPLAGRVAGRIPQLVYGAGRLAVDGELRMELFDGEVTVSDLALENPFGVVPVLRADVRLADIDLAVLTRSLSFGGIEGRLEGRVDGLVLEAWQPVAFDAVFATPAGDRSAHRISQRAVDNLASLGGAQAVLSSTLLRFFEEFSYRRLGLSCRLRAGVCEMGGVAEAKNGYYIVQGGGLPPRVDVIGFNRRVDWKTLLERLRAVASSGPPQVR